MGMKFHGTPNNVLNLLEKPVVDFKEGVHDSPLNRLKSVFQIRNGSVADNIACVFNKVFVKNVFYKCQFIFLRLILL